MSRVGDERLENWHCSKCQLTYVPGDAVAAVAARPSEFGVLLREAKESSFSSRGLSCPRCQALLRELRVRGVTIDMCDICGGVVLDPGEKKALKRLASSPPGKVDAAFDVVSGVEAAAQLAALIARSVL